MRCGLSYGAMERTLTRADGTCVAERLASTTTIGVSPFGCRRIVRVSE